MSNFDHREHLLHIIEKYLGGRASESEVAFLKRYYGHFEKEQDILDVLTPEERGRIGAKIEDAIMMSIAEAPPRVHRTLWRPLAWAATATLAVCAGVYYYYSSDASFATSQQMTSARVDVLPGGNKATLTLADGSRILLDDVKTGEVAEQSGVSVRKTDDGQVIYEANASGGDIRESAQSFNTITTPWGGTYQVILPDGTRVWLNAGSSLKFPTFFSGDERKVELSGEGYFEVARNEQMPFRVRTRRQDIEVLGTVFNINSYDDEPAVTTTLLEGSVRVTSNNEAGLSGGKGLVVVLRPGEQSALSDEGFQVGMVNTDVAVAWKRGVFKFDNSDIRSVMRQISKWYNVEVEFEGEVPEIRLWGEMDRSVNASEALEMLEYFDLEYRIVEQGATKKIIIS